MAEKNLEEIPTLQDIVEPGSSSEEENIRIVADDSLDDVYDEEFSKLFDSTGETAGYTPTTDPEGEITNLDKPESVITDTDEPSINSVSAAQSDTDEINIHTDDDVTEASSDALDIDNTVVMLDDEIKASSDDFTNRDKESPEPLWIEDWQEEVVQSAVSSDDFNNTASISDEETELLIEQAVEADGITDETISPADRPILQTVESTSDTTAETTSINRLSLDTGEIVNQIVSELMPEIEWKLRGKIREVLEQHYPQQD